MSSSKIRVAVLYGGRSGEHEISLISAASVIRNLNPIKYDVVPIAIDKQGKWHEQDVSKIDLKAASLPVYKQMTEAVLPARPNEGGVVLSTSAQSTSKPIDVFFPVLHGTMGEDGTIQGLLEMAEVPYVGSGVLASSVGMDKDVAKRLARDSGISIVPYEIVKQGQWPDREAEVVAKIEKNLGGYPVFVKPANMGSSVGVAKVKSRAQLDSAIKQALQYDVKVLIEKAIDAREIEIAVLENIKSVSEPLTSIVGEIQPTHEFYSYESKYLDENGAELYIPAKMDEAQMKQAQQMASKVFVALECQGMARVDLFLDRKSGEFYLNEINTIPGFTQISMYPKLWEASGLAYSELLDKLIELALERGKLKKKLLREFSGASKS